MLNRVQLSAILIFFFADAAHSVWADDCSSVDLREPGGSLESVAPTSQGYGRSNLCGFYSASTLIDAWRGAHSESKISPIALGVEHAVSKNVPIWFPIQNTSDPLNNQGGRAGSMVCSVVSAARRLGGCIDPDLRSDDFVTSAQWADKTVLIYKILQRYGMKSKGKRKQQLPSVAEEIYRIYLNSDPRPTKSIVSRDALASLIRLNARKPYRIIHALFYPACNQKQNRVELTQLPSCKSGMSIDHVDNELGSAKPLPVSFTYCARIHRDGPGILNGTLMPARCGMHWSLVIGRKRINGKCHYLIRNSYHPEQPLHPAFVRDGMDFWMDRETLRRASYLFQWLAK